MRGQLTTHPVQLLVFLLCLLSDIFDSAFAQTDADGYRSTVFDPKYIPYQELLISPKTHPGLFSFTGRWHRRRQKYTASTWPGTYVTALVYGSTCIIKLRPKPAGKIDAYSFYVSIDGGEDLLYTLPPFDSTDRNREIIFVPLTIPKPDSPPGYQPKTLEPHTVRILSISDTPFSFEGFLVENTLVRQGALWTDGQDERLYLEFIGEGIDAEVYGGLLGWDSDVARSGDGIGDEGQSNDVQQIHKNSISVLNSTQFRAAEILGVRHSHADSGTCFSSDCDHKDPLPGLAEQYFHENPISPKIRSDQLKKGTKQFQKLLQQDWQFLAEDPWVKTAIPNAVIVDVGVRDFLRIEQPVSGEIFARELLVFLGRLRESARPESTIIVIGRDWQKADKSAFMGDLKSIVPVNSNTMTLRKMLYEITKQIVAQIQEEDKNIIFTTIIPTKSPKIDLLHVICSTLIPQFHPDPITTTVEGKSKLQEKKPSRQQQVCQSISNSKHATITTSPPEQQTLDNTILKSEDHSAPHATAHSSRFVTLYALALVVFICVILFLLSKPIMVILTNMGLIKGNRRVYGVRDVEGGFGFGRNRNLGRFGKSEKNSISLPRSMSGTGSDEEGFVVLAGGGSASLSGRRGGGRNEKK